MKNKFLEIALVILLFILISFVYTLPLIFHLTSAIPIGPGKGFSFMVPGDPMESYYFFWNFKDSLLRGEIPFFAKYHFATGGKPEAIGFTRFPMTVLYFLFSPLGETTAYNLLTLISFPLTGLFTYWLLKLYFKSRKAALIGALVATLIPFRQVQLLSGHLNGLIYFLLPLNIYFYELAFENRKILWAFLSALTTITLALSAEVHLFLYFLIFAAFHIFFKFFYLIKNKPAKNELKKWTAIFLVVFLGAFLALGYTFFMKKMVVEGSDLAAGRSLREVRTYSAFITSFFNRRVASAEIYTYLGFFAFLLAVLAFFDPDNRRHYKMVFLILFLVVLAFLFVKINQIEGFLKFKHRLRFWVNFTTLPVAGVLFFWTLAKLFLQKKEDKKFIYLFFALIGLVWSLGTRFPLYRWGYDFVPYLKFFRSPARAMALAALGLSVLAAAGWLNLEKLLSGFLKNKKRLPAAAFLTVLFLLSADYSVSPGVFLTTLEKTNPIYEKIKNSPPAGEKILELPVLTGTLHQNSLYEYYIIIHRHPIINGYHPYPSQSYNEIYLKLREINKNLTKKNFELLKKLNVRYLVLHQRFYEEIPTEYLVFDEFSRKLAGPKLFQKALTRLQNSPYLKEVAEDNGLYLFKLKENNQ